MKLLMILMVLLSVAFGSDDLEFGVFTGAFIPAATYIRDTYSTSVILGVDLLFPISKYTLEASISTVLLRDHTDIENFSASMLPLRMGIRQHIGPIFMGGGMGMYLVTERYDDPKLGEYDETSDLWSSYFLLGAPLSISATDAEICISFHMVDQLLAKSWVGLTAGIKL